jgi:hypothetical protein
MDKIPEINIQLVDKTISCEVITTTFAVKRLKLTKRNIKKYTWPK